MLEIQTSKFINLSFKVKILFKSAFKNLHPNSTSLFSLSMSHIEFREIFKQDIWNCLFYQSDCSHMISDFCEYKFRLNMNAIMYDLREIIIKKYLSHIPDPEKITINYNSQYRGCIMIYKFRELCIITDELIVHNISKNYNRILCVKYDYNDKNVPINIQLVTLNTIIEDINRNHNLISQEYEYGYDLIDTESRSVIKIIFDNNEFEKGLYLFGERS